MGSGNDIVELDDDVTFNGDSFHDGDSDTVGDTRFDQGATFNGTNIFVNFEFFAEVIVP